MQKRYIEPFQYLFTYQFSHRLSTSYTKGPQAKCLSQTQVASRRMFAVISLLLCLTWRKLTKLMMDNFMVHCTDRYL